MRYKKRKRYLIERNNHIVFKWAVVRIKWKGPYAYGTNDRFTFRTREMARNYYRRVTR